MGISNTCGNIAGILAPLVVGSITTDVSNKILNNKYSNTQLIMMMMMVPLTATMAVTVLIVISVSHQNQWLKNLLLTNSGILVSIALRLL